MSVNIQESKESGQSFAPRVIDELEKGQFVGQREIALSRADLVRYAAASGDHNPIHWNERFAQEVGLPGVIAHGMLTMGLAVDLVSEWAGDPARVVDYQARFTKPVPVPDAEEGSPESPTANLLVTGKIGAVERDSSTARVDLTVELLPNTEDHEAKPVKVLAKSQVQVRLDERAR